MVRPSSRGAGSSGAAGAPPQPARKHWGWGYAHEQPRPADLRAAAAALGAHLGLAVGAPESPVPLARVKLPASRLRAPRALAAFCSGDKHARARHCFGSSYIDTVQGFRGRFPQPPDLVAYPRGERDLEQLLEWCSAGRIAAVPYGGGTSVVGGVEMPRGAAFEGAISIDTAALAGLHELDAKSLAARIGAGSFGPQIESALAQAGLTLRHFPQSFQFSTLGGWIATRAAGHFATGPTHIEDRVESIRAITPSGRWQSARLPASGAAVSPDRMLAGSEGTLGVITEAWVRVLKRPDLRAGGTVRLPSFAAACRCAQAIVQSGLEPANCRVLDAVEMATGMLPPGGALLLLGFETARTSADGKVDGAWLDAQLALALAICREHGGEVESPRWALPDRAGGRGNAAGGGAPRGGSSAGRPAGGMAAAQSAGGAAADPAGSWRAAFFAAPYLRDVMVSAGILSETFECAATWDRLPALIEAVGEAAERVIAEQGGGPIWRERGDGAGARPPKGGGGARLGCRLTHVYRDGAAPYFTVIVAARRGEEVDQWLQIKRAVSDALSAAGGTITHHHAVGRDHMPWYGQQRPELFARSLAAVKSVLDPAGVMNPGVLLDAGAAA